nr:hypothetical protein [uncultured Amphritea sp.]
MFKLVNSTSEGAVLRIVCFSSEFKTLPLIVGCHYLVIDEVTERMVDWHWVDAANDDESGTYKASDSVAVTDDALYSLLENTDLAVFLCSDTHLWRKKVIEQLGRYDADILLIAVHWSADQIDDVRRVITSEYKTLSYDGNLICGSLEDAVSAVRGIIELIMDSSLIAIDFADVRSVLKSNEALQLHVAFGHSTGKGAALDAITSALSQISLPPLEAVLVTIYGGPDINLQEFSIVTEAVENFVVPEGRVVVGMVRRQEFEDNGGIDVSLVAGVTEIQ